MRPNSSFSVVANWSARAEAPEGLAMRAIDTLQQLRPLDPAFSQWYRVNRAERGAFSTEPLDLEATSISKWIADSVSRSRDRTPEPVYGYLARAYNFSKEERPPGGVSFGFTGGCGIPSLRNSCTLTTAYGITPDPSFVTFAIIRGALLALAEPFGATVAYGRPDALYYVEERKQKPPRLPTAWITYLAPRFAPMISPPASAVVERRPDGGLLMAATDETFLVDNPAHMAIARDIAAAVAPFNALPWPQEDHDL